METPTKEQLLASDLFYSLAPAEQTALLGKVDSTFAGFDVVGQRRAVEALNAARKAPSSAAEPATFTKTAESSIARQIWETIADPQGNVPYITPALKAAGKAALPIAGGAAGLYGGTALGGPAGGVIGEALGGGAGEIGNQLLGITEPSLTQIGLATAAGPVTRGVVGAARLGGGTLLRSFGGRQNVAEVAGGIARKMYLPPTASEALFEQAAQVNAQIPTHQAAATVSNILKVEKGNLQTDVSKQIQNTLQEYVPWLTTGNTPNAQNVATAARDLRQVANEAYKSGNSRFANAISEVRNSLFDDAAASGLPIFKQAAGAYRREMAVEELAGIMRQAQPLKAFEDLASKKSLFVNAFGDAEKSQIKEMLVKLANVSPSGHSGVVGRSVAGGAGSLLGSSAVEKTVGFIAGYIAPDVAAYALTSRAGRNFMEKLLVGNVWDAPKAAALATFVRAQQANDAKNSPVADAIKSIFKDESTNLQTKVQAALMGAQAGGSQGLGLGLSRDVPQ